jgi:transcriptional regulator with XRE-family HTH domain
MRPPLDPVLLLLFEYRAAARVRHDDLAAHLGVSPRTLRAWQRGQVSPPLRVLRPWAAALGHPLRFTFDYQPWLTIPSRPGARVVLL